MRVISKLAQIDFQFGRITRDGNLLVIESHKDSKMPSTVFVSPEDVIEVAKRFLLSPRGMLFILGFPYFFYRWKKYGQEKTRKSNSKKNWPTV